MSEEEITQNFYEIAVNEYLDYVKHRGYIFTTDWMSYHTPLWNAVLNSFKNSPVNCLEIGSWEGRSTCWFLENILTHESATMTCIDTFQGGSEHQDYPNLETIESRFDFNINLTGHPEKVNKLVGISQEVLRTLPLRNYEIIYLDGSHVASDVLEDAVLSWRLLKKGGILMFDDYLWPVPEGYNHPKLGIDSFLNSFGDKLNIIHHEYQVFIEKKVDH